MEAAYSLDGDDPPVPHRRRGRAQRGVIRGERLAHIVPQREARPASGARVRLGMKAAVGGVVVFRAAVRAHREMAHRGPRAVVRDVLDDAVARPALGAVDERIEVAAVRGIEQLAQAVRAGREIGKHLGRVYAGGIARANRESVVAIELDLFCFDRRHRGVRRRLLADHAQQRGDAAGIALGLDGHAFGRVADPTAELEPSCAIEDERPEPDPLHRAANEDTKPRARDRISAGAWRQGHHPGQVSTSMPSSTMSWAFSSWMSSETMTSRRAPSAMVPWLASLEMLRQMLGRDMAQRSEANRDADDPPRALGLRDVCDPAHQAGHQRGFMHRLYPPAANWAASSTRSRAATSATAVATGGDKGAPNAKVSPSIA